MSKLGDLLKELRGLNSLRTISAKIEKQINDKFSHTKLDNIEKGKTSPSLDDLKILSHIYNHPYEDFLKIGGYIKEKSDEKVERLFNRFLSLSDEDKKKFIKLIK